MQKQAVIDLIFDKTVETIHTVFIARATVPVLFMLSVWGVMLSQPFEQDEEEWRFGTALQQLKPLGSLPHYLVPQLPVLNLEASTVSAPLYLTKQQRNLVQYISSAYRVDSSDIARYVSIAYSKAREFKVDPFLVLAIMSIESSFDPMAQSPVGAQGLMQVLTRVHTDKFQQFGGAKLAFDIEANIHVGTQIIRDYVVREGSIELALKSYVGAALMSDDGGYGWKVMGQMERLKAVALGKPLPVIAQRKPAADTLATSEVSRSKDQPESPVALYSDLSVPTALESLSVPVSGTIAVGYTAPSKRESVPNEPVSTKAPIVREASHAVIDNGSSSE
jgi:Transglycosylase SLT domain